MNVDLSKREMQRLVMVLDNEIRVQSVTPADADVHAVYQYLITQEGHS